MSAVVHWRGRGNSAQRRWTTKQSITGYGSFQTFHKHLQKGSTTWGIDTYYFHMYNIYEVQLKTKISTHFTLYEIFFMCIIRRLIKKDHLWWGGCWPSTHHLSIERSRKPREMMNQYPIRLSKRNAHPQLGFFEGKGETCCWSRFSMH